MAKPWPTFSDAEILAVRPAKNALDSRRPYAYFVERERASDGEIHDVATVFLTNRECPFRCLMCDLWKNTLDDQVPLGSIGEQVDFALQRMPPTSQIKLYNSGNFFDGQAIPRDEFPALAERLAGYERVIVESHPRLCGSACETFRRMLQPQLEVALGLETAHPEVLARLNKQMTLDDFASAVEHLTDLGIDTRAFVLLRPPFLTEQEGVDWALRSIEFAFSTGVGCCAVIPTRGGNGVLDRLAQDGLFAPPSLQSLERVLETGLGMKAGRVFADLWDCDRLAACPECRTARTARMHEMNLSQELAPPVQCPCLP